MKKITNQMIERGKDVFDILYNGLTIYFDRNAPLLAAGLSFYAIFSAAPLAIFAVGIAKLFISDAHARASILELVQRYAGKDVESLVEQVMSATEHASGGFFATIVGAGVVIFGGHAIFVQLRRAINAIMGVAAQDNDSLKDTVFNVLSERFSSFLTMFFLGIMFVGYTIMSLFGGLFLTFISSYVTLPDWLNIAPVLDFCLSFGMGTFVVAAVYRTLPIGHYSWCFVLPGSMLTAATFFVLKLAVSYYLASASTVSTYGAAGSVIALMVWVYFSSLVILFGAELNMQVAQFFLAKKEDLSYPSFFSNRQVEDAEKCGQLLRERIEQHCAKRGN